MLLCKKSPNILCCTEARVTEDISDSEISVDGYNVIRSNSPSRHSGGVVVYIANTVQYEVKSDIVFEYNNILVVDIMNESVRGRWIFVYHSPNSPHCQFLSRLEQVLEHFGMIAMKLYVTGDFNIDIHENSADNTYKSRLSEVKSRFGLKQFVRSFTRVNGASRSVIDHFYSNDNQVIVEVDDNDEIADHKTVLIYKRNVQRTFRIRKVKDHSRYNSAVFQQSLSERLFVDFAGIESLSLNEKVGILENNVRASVGDLVSEKLINEQYSCEWFDNELKVLREEKNSACMRAGIRQTPECWSEYRQIRNLYNKRLNQKKNCAIKDNIVNNRHDPKRLWKILKDH